MEGGEISSYAREVFDYVNQLRMCPQGFVSYLLERLKHFRGMNYCPPMTNMAIRTLEGPAGVESAISFLQTATAVAPLSLLSPGLCRSCLDLCLDAGPLGSVGNLLSDGTTLEMRIQRYGNWSGSLTECTAYGSPSPLDSVLQWLIDDGNPNRTHRQSIMNPTYTAVGIAEAPHSLYKVMVVMDLTTSYTDWSAVSDPYRQFSPYCSPILEDGGVGPAPGPNSFVPQLDNGMENVAQFNVYEGDGGYLEDQSGSYGNSLNKFDSVSTGSTYDYDSPAFRDIPPSSEQTPRMVEPQTSSEVFVTTMNVEVGRLKLEAASLPGPPILREIQLHLHGHRLVLTVDGRQNSSIGRHYRSWELPFVPQPSQIKADYIGTTVTIYVSIPAPTDKPFKFGNFIIPPSSSGRDRVLIAAQQIKGLIVLTCIPSKYETAILCECIGSELVISSRHKEMQSNQVVEIQTKRGIPLPFPPVQSSFQLVSNYRIKVTYPALPPNIDSTPIAIPIQG